MFHTLKNIYETYKDVLNESFVHQTITKDEKSIKDEYDRNPIRLFHLKYKELVEKNLTDDFFPLDETEWIYLVDKDIEVLSEVSGEELNYDYFFHTFGVDGGDFVLQVVMSDEDGDTDYDSIVTVSMYDLPFEYAKNTISFFKEMIGDEFGDEFLNESFVHQTEEETEEDYKKSNTIFRFADDIAQEKFEEDYEPDNGSVFTIDEIEKIDDFDLNVFYKSDVENLSQLAAFKSLTEFNPNNWDGWNFAGCRSLHSISIPENIKYIRTADFFLTESLKNVVFCGNKLKKIEDYAFAKSGIEEITIPEGCEEIDNGAFHSCENLRIVNLPSSLQKLGDKVFMGCKNLQRVTGIERFGKEKLYGSKLNPIVCKYPDDKDEIVIYDGWENYEYITNYKENGFFEDEEDERWRDEFYEYYQEENGIEDCFDENDVNEWENCDINIDSPNFNEEKYQAEFWDWFSDDYSRRYGQWVGDKEEWAFEIDVNDRLCYADGGKVLKFDSQYFCPYYGYTFATFNQYGVEKYDSLLDAILKNLDSRGGYSYYRIKQTDGGFYSDGTMIYALSDFLGKYEDEVSYILSEDEWDENDLLFIEPIYTPYYQFEEMYWDKKKEFEEKRN